MENKKFLIGRNEWCVFPDLKVPAIKAKIDTGARTSAIHAFNIKPINKKGVPYVSFEVHPLQRNDKLIIKCCAPVYDERSIMSSNGHKENRYIIKTALQMGDKEWEIEVSLSNRDPLRYRLLLGRQALIGHVIIDPGLREHYHKISKKSLKKIYRGLC